MSAFEEIAALYDAPATIPVLLLGGPWDGEEQQVPMGGRTLHDVLMTLLFGYRVPLPPPVMVRPVTDEELFRLPLPPMCAEYRLLLDDVGQPSRDDHGRVRLGFRGLW